MSKKAWLVYFTSVWLVRNDLLFFFLQDAKMNSIKCEMFYTLTKKKKVTGMLFETKKY